MRASPQEYVCRSLKDTLDENASELLGAVNGFAAGSWPLLLSAAKLDAARLPPASAAEEAVARGERAAAPKSGGALRPPRLPPLPPLDVFEGDGQEAMARSERAAAAAAAAVGVSEGEAQLPPLPPLDVFEGEGQTAPLPPLDVFEGEGRVRKPPLPSLDVFEGEGQVRDCELPMRLPPLPPLNVFEGDGQGRPPTRSRVLLLRLLLEFSLVLEEQGPLGMQIDIVELPGGGRRLLVAGLVPGAQVNTNFSYNFKLRNRKYAVEQGMLLGAGLVPGAEAERQLGSAASEVVGSELVGLGSERLDDRPLEHCLTLLRDAPRPVKIVTPADVIRVSFTDQSLGLRFKPSPLHGPTATEIAGFARAPDGTERVAEACGQVAPGQVLWAINGNRVLGVAFQQVVQQLKGLPRPIEFALLDVPDVHVEFTAPPLDLRLQYMQGHIVVIDIVKVESPLCEKLQQCHMLLAVTNLSLPSPHHQYACKQASQSALTTADLRIGGLCAPALCAEGLSISRVSIPEGHVLLTVNGLSLPSPHGKYDKDVAMLSAPTMYPLKLRFARDNSAATGATPPGSPGSDNGDAAAATAAAAAAADGYMGSGYVTSYKRSMGRAVEVTVADPEDMAMAFEKGKDGRPRIKALSLVDGPARHSNRVQVGMVLMAINGVPLSKKANTCASCRQLLAATSYPATITFRNMSAFLAAAQRL
ncbi:hypothetical protein JKP88DRAFT_351239 [Tribonema minus]|uniref:PDZ domain-containing protein n=1 Tax=Tribonema minus TaxID=303371 RepID=A0A835YT37_9STRA|nr:hypothetical protein JKP88DRAFT_351239 [Tribonema minus]